MRPMAHQTKETSRVPSARVLCKPLLLAREVLPSRGLGTRLPGDPGDTQDRAPTPWAQALPGALQAQRDYLSEPPWPRSAVWPGQSRRPAASTGSGEAQKARMKIHSRRAEQRGWDSTCRDATGRQQGAQGLA